MLSWALLAQYWGPMRGVYTWNLACCLFTCYRYTGRWFNSDRRQVEMFAWRKTSLRFCLYLLILFLPALQDLDLNGIIVWWGGGRSTPFYTMFQGLHCLGYLLGLVRNDPRTLGILWYPIPLNPFPQPSQPLTFTYESVPPSITDFIGSYFLEHQAGSGRHFRNSTPP